MEERRTAVKNLKKEEEGDFCYFRIWTLFLIFFTLWSRAGKSQSKIHDHHHHLVVVKLKVKVKEGKRKP